MAEDHQRVISRRELLRGAAVLGAAAAAGCAHGGSVPADAASLGDVGGTAGALAGVPASGAAGAYQHLTAVEAELLERIVDQLIPADELGPGAAQAGVVRYIDRALGGALAGWRGAYRSGLAALEQHCQESRGAPFAQLSRRDQAAVLTELETGAVTRVPGGSGAFFGLLLSHTRQGMFGDPYYGGNTNFAGWDLLGYPGVRIAVSADDQRRLEGGTLAPVRRSAYENEMFNKATAQSPPSVHGHGD